MSVALITGLMVGVGELFIGSALHVPKYAANSSVLSSGSKSHSGLDFDVVVPDGDGPFPVIILLHEKSPGSPSVAMQNYLATFKKKFAKAIGTHIQVAAVGSNGAWNLYAEPTTRDDVTLIGTTLIQYLRSFSNVHPTFKLMGHSNGAGLINRILIENGDASIVSAVTCGSQLNTKQWHDDWFFIGGTDNAYTTKKHWLLQRRLLQITGTDDPVIPSKGGETNTCGKLVFLPWAESIYHYAEAYGYTGGEQLVKKASNVLLNEYVSYLNGQVQAYNVLGANHETGSMLETDLIEPFLLE